nr:ankyrin repeat domain-containing protein 6-like [Lytechinus pictus]
MCISTCTMNSLLLAVKANDVSEIQRLLLFSPICRKLVNYQAPQNHETPIFVASVRGYTGVVHWLLNRGARVDVTTSWGATALHAAAERGHDSIVKLLVEQKVPLHIQTHYGDTALHLAAYRGHHRVILLLLAAGIDTTITNSKGRTAVDEAELAGHHIISKRLRCERPSRSGENPEGERYQTAFGSSRTELLKNKPAPQKTNVTAWVDNTPGEILPCNPPCDIGLADEKYPGQLDTQARTKKWVLTASAEPMKTSSNVQGSQTKVEFPCDEETVFTRPTPVTSSNTGSKVKPMNFSRRKAAMLKDLGKSHSCEGICMETKIPREMLLPDVDDVTTRPHARCRRVNSLERAVEELQDELRTTRDEMERAKADIIDIHDMMRLCWARGGAGAVFSDRAAASEASRIGQRFVISPVPSDVIGPFSSRRHSNPFQIDQSKEISQSDAECMSE